MNRQPTRYKRVRHYHEPGDCHELTFSCYRRMPLLTDDTWLRILAGKIDEALVKSSFRLMAFVFMPEHVHLLVYPTLQQPRVDYLLACIKRPHSVAIKELLTAARDPLLADLTIRERPGKTVFRYWQEGAGYDRNLSTSDAVLASIDYIHMNPVRRGLCNRAADWKWSSASYFLDSEKPRNSDLPTIHGVPSELFS